MENRSKSDPFLMYWESVQAKGIVPAKCMETLKSFYLEYKKSAKEAIPPADILFISLLEQIESQIEHPVPFAPFHQKIREPFDYYQFGLNFIDPLLIKEESTLPSDELLRQVVESLEKKENVIFFANHQIEADPQVIAALLKDSFPKLAKELIFVAGERVITDPLAIPFSRGTDLLCIYSKRYIDHPPEMRTEKQRHNQRTMDLMRSLLSGGGKAIYVAPSGGRDRRGNDGNFTVAPFDPQSIEMFYLMAKRAKRKTHFYPMALKTYPILPPPETIQIELGEERRVGRSAVHLAIGDEIDMETDFPSKEKHAKRVLRAKLIHKLVSDAYNCFPPCVKQDKTQKRD